MVKLPAADFTLNIWLIGQINHCGTSLIAWLYVRISVEMIVSQFVSWLVCLKHDNHISVLKIWGDSLLNSH